VADQKGFAILTAEISKATFGVTPAGYKKLKGLKRENLRDHMTDLELIFTMLGEAATTEITRNKDAQGFDQNKTAAREGGSIAGNARRQVEAKSGRKVITRDNYLTRKPQPKLPPKAEESSS
jgi:DNA-damage-inducible protein D